MVLLAVGALVGAVVAVNHFYPAKIGNLLREPVVWGALAAWFAFWLLAGLYSLARRGKLVRRGRRGEPGATPDGLGVDPVESPPTA